MDEKYKNTSVLRRSEGFLPFLLLCLPLPFLLECSLVVHIAHVPLDVFVDLAVFQQAGRLPIFYQGGGFHLGLVIIPDAAGYEGVAVAVIAGAVAPCSVGTVRGRGPGCPRELELLVDAGDLVLAGRRDAEHELLGCLAVLERDASRGRVDVDVFELANALIVWYNALVTDSQEEQRRGRME